MSPPAPAYGLALVLALAQTLWLFPPAFLAGHSGFFFDGDVAKDIAGWLAYAGTPWHWPWLHTPRLNAPEGMSIALMDSIPLMAVLLKPFAFALPDGAHYFGAWHGLAMALQSVAAVYLVRQLGARSLPAAAAAAALALAAPVLLHRFGHSALMAQGLVLLALGLYFHALAASLPAWRRWAPGVGVFWLALLVHPYLSAMCLAVLAAALVDVARQRGQWRTSVMVLGIAIAGAAVLAASMGLFAGGMSTGAYGRHAMRLNAPFCGGDSARWLTCDPGGGESMAYLGAGALLLVILAVLRPAQPWRALAQRHAGLFLVGALLTLLAISHVIGMGQHILVTLPLPARLVELLGTFQASARFFWPVAYLATFAALATVLRWHHAGAALLVIALALALQWTDTSTRRGQIRANAAEPVPIQAAEWPAALRDVREVAIYPAFGCGELDAFAYLPVQYLAMREGASLNTAYAARGAADCAAKHARFDQDLPAHALWIAPRDMPAQALPAGLRQAILAGQCQDILVEPTLWGEPRPTRLRACRTTATP